MSNVPKKGHLHHRLRWLRGRSRQAHADKAYLEDVRHTDAIAEICRKEQADGIIASFSDLLAECMIDIADAAGLPSYLKPKGEKLLRRSRL